MKTPLFILTSFILVIFFAGCANGKYDEFAQCITQKEYKMYGLYTCSHCKDQKDAFGSSFQYIDYIECHPKASDNRAQECLDEGIKGYPTWVGPDDKRIEGFRPLQVLAEESGCKLPEELD